jgi:hypothetical protein
MCRIFLGYMMGWVRGKAGVEKQLDFWMFFQVLGDLHCVLAGALDSHLEGLGTPHNHETLHRCQEVANRLGVPGQLVMHLLVIQHDASSLNIRMSTDILGH